MSGSTIGIKVADGTYYPILERDSVQKRKLVLSTAKDQQTIVQIDLYEGDGEDIANARYVGSLMIENIQPAPQGEPEIQMLVGIDEGGSLAAQAEDLASGENQSLNVSLESLAEDSVYDIPEFELDEEFDPWTAGKIEEVEEEEDSSFDEASDEGFDESFDEDFDDGLSDGLSEYEESLYMEHEEDARPKKRPLMFALFIIFGIAAIAAIAILLYKILEGPTTPPLEAATGSQVEVAEATPAESTTEEVGGETVDTVASSAMPAGQTAEDAHDEDISAGQDARDGPGGDSTTEPAATAQSSKAANIGGVWYWIRWGDTLWDISSSFYRDPWLYGSIAEENSINNPDLIYAGKKIYIPEP